MSDTTPTTPTVEEASLSARIARGAAWVFGAGLFARFLGAINTIIVARLLAPDDIGLVAIATITMQLLQGLSDIGVSHAVVKFQNAGRDDLNTLFTLSLCRGVLIAMVLLGAGPLAAAIYDDQRMLAVFSAIAAFPVITAMINPRFYEFERDLKFSREFLSTVLNKFAGVTVSVTVAIVFRSYWAIILGLLAGGVTQLFLSYLLRPFAPRLSFRSLGKVFGFSGWVAGVSFVAALNNKLDVPIVARVVGQGVAGAYFMGVQLSEMATAQIALPLTRAIYPGLSSMQDDRERMRAAYLRGVAALGAFALPAALGAAFVANDLVFVVLGGKWRDVTPVIQFLAPVIGMQSLFFATQSYAMAQGRQRLVFFRELVFFLIRMPVFVWAVITHGLIGAIYAAAGLGLFHIALNLALYARVSGAPFWEPLVSARRSFAAGAAMAVYFFALRPIAADFDAAPAILRLAGDVAAGGLVYVFSHWLVWRLESRPGGVEQMMSQALAGAARRFFKR